MVGLQFTALFPDCVSLLMVHEPPVINVLPDAEEWRAYNFDLVRIFQEEGPRPAMMKFAGAMKGITAPPPGGLGQDDSRAFLFSKELLQVAHFMPDLAAIRAAGTKTVLLRGAASEDAYYARTAPIVAELAGGTCVTVPGNHLAFTLEPETFCKAVFHIIDAAQGSS